MNRNKTKHLLISAVAAMLVSGCHSVKSGMQHSYGDQVDFSGLRFKNRSHEFLALGKIGEVLVYRIAYTNIDDKPLEAIFLPRFVVLDKADRVFVPETSLGLEAGSVALDVMNSQVDQIKPLNPGVSREATIAFQLPKEIAASEALRLRVMCPDRARAGFMMQQATVSGPYFFYCLDGLEATATASAQPDTASTEQANPGKRPLHNGMSRQDVYELWGEPTGKSDMGSFSMWTYMVDGGMVLLTFKANALYDYVQPFVPGKK